MIDNFPNHFPVMGTGIIIHGDQVNPDSTGWELGIRNPTMGTIQGVCTRGKELATHASPSPPWNQFFFFRDRGLWEVYNLLVCIHRHYLL